MKQRLSTLLLTLVLTHLPFARLVNAQTSVNELKQTARVRSDIRKRLSSKNTQVRVRLRNGQELHGLVDQADDRGFQLVDGRTGDRIEVAYSDVVAVKGRGLSTAAKIGIITAVTVGLVVTIGALSMRNFDPFKHGVLR